MDHQPLLPSMSLDSFMNFVEEPGAQHADAPAKAAMLRQARLQPRSCHVAFVLLAAYPVFNMLGRASSLSAHVADLRSIYIR